MNGLEKQLIKKAANYKMLCIFS